MPLHNTKQHPRHGWIYREVLAGKSWTVRDPMMPFLMVAKQICAARQNNGIECRTGDAVKALGDYTCTRLDNDPRWCEGQPGEESLMEKRVRKGCEGCGRKRKR